MTKPKPKPKYVIDAPLPDYFAPGNAVRGAIGLIPKENRTSITIDTDKYNEVAWELVDESQKRYAGPNTVIDECTQINKVAWELINLLNNASTTTINAIDKREIDYGIPGNDKTFNLGDAHFSVIGIIQATEKAKASIESGNLPPGIKGRGPEVDRIAIKIRDMIAYDYYLLTLNAPALTNALGHKKPIGKYFEFFSRVFSSIFPGRDCVSPAREAAKRLKEKMHIV